MSPILLFVYARPEHTQKTIESLLQNKEASFSDLIIFSDAPKNEKSIEKVQFVRKYIQTISGFKSIKIIEQKENLGLAQSIVFGVTNYLAEYETVIVIEDDMLFDINFLEYMNFGLETYKNDDNVASIHGYCYPVNENLEETFFLKGADCWGWATWQRAWKHFEKDGEKLKRELIHSKSVWEFNFQGNYWYFEMLERQILAKNDSWAVRWYASTFLKNMYTLYPGKSLVSNQGFDDSGNHSGSQQDFKVNLTHSKLNLYKIPIVQNQKAYLAFSGFFKNLKVSTIKKLKNKFLSWWFSV